MPKTRGGGRLPQAGRIVRQREVRELVLLKEPMLSRLDTFMTLWPEQERGSGKPEPVPHSLARRHEI